MTIQEPLSKRAFDIVISLLGLAVSGPLWVLISIAIWADDGPPVFYFQERVGRHGRRFRLWKFRSMVGDAEGESGPVAATEDDPRMTRVGRILRKSAMDELPQLINILSGDMSFVGPRADRPWELENPDAPVVGEVRGGQRPSGLEVGSSPDNPGFFELIPGYAGRLLVRPGLTGLAQIYARCDTPRRQKLRFDRLYIRNMSFWLDARLMLASLWISLRGEWENRDRKL